MNNVKLLKGNNIDLLRELEDNSVDSIVTDPPYGLSFMGKKWDYDVPTVELWEECLRVLKPGGHLLAFSGTRTYHRMVVRIEDAGFEIRDMISWVYGSGFPKSMDISKQIDKRSGVEREVIGTKGINSYKTKEDGQSRHKGLREDFDKVNQLTAPATDEAKQWSGWGTALKPAVEPVVMARKPIEESTVAENVLKYGTGGINIDESRIPTNDSLGGGATNGSVLNIEGFDRPWMHNEETIKEFADKMKQKVEYSQALGRFPANLILDEEAGKLLDEQSGYNRGQQRTVTGKEPSHSKKNEIYGDYSMVEGKYAEPKDGLGGASRFFYCPKVSKSERNEGLDGFVGKQVGTYNAHSADLANYGGSSLGAASMKGEYKMPEEKKNHHPTVKPIALMEYLIRLVTPKGGITLDPFMGSGSTGKAAVRGGFGFIGMELEEEYFDIAEARINWELDKPKKETKSKKDTVSIKKETQETLSKFFD